MNYLYKISIVLLIAVYTPHAFSQQKPKKTETIEFHVSGVCDQCKVRIENAALIKGVKMAEWNKETHHIKVVYTTTKTSEMDIHMAIAEFGHDTEKVKAKDEDYEKLPGCCAYRDGVRAH